MVAIFLTAGWVVGCGSSSQNSNSLNPNALSAGNSSALVSWSGGATEFESDTIRLQLEPWQDAGHQDWQGLDVIHISGILPDSLTVTASAMLSPEEFSGDPDHDHDQDHDHDGYGHEHGGYGHDGGQAEQGAIVRILSSGPHGSQPSGESAARLSHDPNGNLMIRAQGLRFLLSNPSCGSSYVLEIELRRARLLLPFELDC